MVGQLSGTILRGRSEFLSSILFPFEGMPASEVLCALLSVREYRHRMPSSMTCCGCLICTQVLRGPH